jgi:hypothetical protein
VRLDEEEGDARRKAKGREGRLMTSRGDAYELPSLCDMP